ncbi:MAG: Stp1/IreP family PP2C-type Ser/Thr phosphatase [Chloroflexota bacterium]|nr:Stp1/IreP family PP2C-type Ser/Thr phosphatase [Chloroflexota bacterium]
MPFTLTTTTLAIVVGVFVLVAVLLAFGLSRLKTSGRDQNADGPAVSGEQDNVDEITQRLPPSVRSTVQGASSATLRAAARTDRGRVRPSNEDDTLILDLKDDSGIVRTALYAVADGVGGKEKGEVASHTAIEATIRALQAHPFFENEAYLQSDFDDDSVVEIVRSAVMSANREVYGVRVDQNSDMGTTLVLALVMQGKAFVANVGDSRAYLVRDDQIQKLTEDHSLVERMVASGQITSAEARLHPRRNVILRSLGTDPQVEVDLYVEALQAGDRLLLCSDGLSGMLPDEALAQISGRERDVDRACRALVRAANDAGGMDNISVVLAEVVDSPDS